MPYLPLDKTSILESQSWSFGIGILFEVLSCQVDWMIAYGLHVDQIKKKKKLLGRKCRAKSVHRIHFNMICTNLYSNACFLCLTPFGFLHLTPFGFLHLQRQAGNPAHYCCVGPKGQFAAKLFTWQLSEIMSVHRECPRSLIY